MTKEEKRIIKQLKKEKNYEEIFYRFGQKAYNKYADKEYQKFDLEKLKKEGKYEAIYLRYGSHKYNKLLRDIKQEEIEAECGKFSIDAIKNRIKVMLGMSLSALGIATAGTAALVGNTIYQSEKIKSQNEEEYKDLIEAYTERIDQYAEHINEMGLTDLEIFMKTIDDVYKSSIGYGTANINIEGYFGIDLEIPKGTGVCLNLEENIERKLNAIDEDYNARLCAVYSKHGDFDETLVISTQKDDIDVVNNKFDEIDIIGGVIHIAKGDESTKTIGNHAVVAVDLKEDDITLIIDPTACVMGVFKDGKITILNSLNKEEPYELYRTPIREIAYRGTESLQVPKEYIKSFLNPSMSIEEINEKYGIEAQKEALESARKKEENYIYKQANQNNFKAELKVDVEESRIYTVKEIEELYRKCNTMMFWETCDNEKLIKVVNIIRKINNSMKYYDEKQEEIIGKDIKDSEKISSRIRKSHKTYNVENNLINLMIQNEVVNLPDTDNMALKFGICSAYLESGNGENLQNLKMVFKEEEETCYVLNNNEVFAIVRPNEDDGVTYITENSITEEELDDLLEIAKPAINEEQKTKTQDDNNKDEEER